MTDGSGHTATGGTARETTATASMAKHMAAFVEMEREDSARARKLLGMARAALEMFEISGSSHHRARAERYVLDALPLMGVELP